MTLDEAINHCEEVSKECKNTECSLDHLQLAAWLKELKQGRESWAKKAETWMRDNIGFTDVLSKEIALSEFREYMKKC